MIRGFTQKQGDGTFDPDIVFSPTAHGPSVRSLLAIAVQQGRTVGQFDVSNAFEQGIFLAGEIIYVRMPYIRWGCAETPCTNCTVVRIKAVSTFFS